MRRLTVDLQEAAARAGLVRRETAKGEAVHRQAGEYYCHDERSRAGDHRHLDAGGDRVAHDREAGVEMPGVPASVTTATDLSSSSKAMIRSPPPLVVLVEGDLRLVDVEMLQEEAGLARVLAGDHIDAAQRFDARSVISPRLPIGVATR